MKVDGRVAVAAVMTAIFAVMAAMAAAYPMESAMVPLVVSVPALLLSAWQLTAEVVNARRADVSPQQRDAASARPRDIREQPARFSDEAAMVAWFAVFVGAVIAGGFLIGGTLAVVAYLQLRLREPLGVTVTAAGLSYLLLYLVFEKVLGLVLFEGLLFGG